MVEKDHRIRYLPVAVRDMEDIFDFISQDDRNGAVDLLEKMDSAISKLVEFPRIGTIPNDPDLDRKGYRVLVVGDYLIFYVITGEEAEIRRVIHGRRKYSFLL